MSIEQLRADLAAAQLRRTRAIASSDVREREAAFQAYQEANRRLITRLRGGDVLPPSLPRGGKEEEKRRLRQELASLEREQEERQRQRRAVALESGRNEGKRVRVRFRDDSTKVGILTSNNPLPPYFVRLNDLSILRVTELDLLPSEFPVYGDYIIYTLPGDARTTIGIVRDADSNSFPPTITAVRFGEPPRLDTFETDRVDVRSFPYSRPKSPKSNIAMLFTTPAGEISARPGQRVSVRGTPATIEAAYIEDGDSIRVIRYTEGRFKDVLERISASSSDLKSESKLVEAMARLQVNGRASVNK